MKRHPAQATSALPIPKVNILILPRVDTHQERGVYILGRCPDRFTCVSLRQKEPECDRDYKSAEKGKGPGHGEGELDRRASSSSP